LNLATSSAPLFTKPVCIVGAGPGGLQLGHLMLDAGRDFVIFEKAAGPGAAFEALPVQRKLISLNKRFTGELGTAFSTIATS
jgi:2-polyprenyl-6-methoxyphenol hydroxylase-like FAD-dependent oxidoreductase